MISTCRMARRPELCQLAANLLALRLLGNPPKRFLQLDRERQLKRRAGQVHNSRPARWARNLQQDNRLLLLCKQQGQEWVDPRCRELRPLSPERKELRRRLSNPLELRK